MYIFKRTQRTQGMYRICQALSATLLTFCVTSNVFADGDRLNAPQLPAYKTECGACHVAYPVSLLPGASWDRLMHNLPHHFGVDASLDASTQNSIRSWLEAHAGSHKKVREEPPGDRITRSAWFVRQHSEIAQATWKRSAIKSASNCHACHAQADQGDFDEDAVRIPK